MIILNLKNHIIIFFILFFILYYQNNSDKKLLFFINSIKYCILEESNILDIFEDKISLNLYLISL